MWENTAGHESIVPLLNPGEDSKYLQVWDSVTCLSPRISTQLTRPKAAGFYCFPESFLKLLQLSSWHLQHPHVAFG